MGYILTFIGGVFLGSLVSVGAMCCFIVSGNESRKEEKMNNGQDKGVNV